MADTNEQWLSEGNCELCRRKKYCGKPCKASKGFMMRQAVQLGARMAAQIMSDYEKRRHDSNQDQEVQSSNN